MGLHYIVLHIKMHIFTYESARIHTSYTESLASCSHEKTNDVFALQTGSSLKHILCWIWHGCSIEKSHVARLFNIVFDARLLSAHLISSCIKPELVLTRICPIQLTLAHTDLSAKNGICAAQKCQVASTHFPARWS